MAFVMGGTETENFKLFVNLCCKGYSIVRKNASTFISLFSMVKKRKQSQQIKTQANKNTSK